MDPVRNSLKAPDYEKKVPEFDKKHPKKAGGHIGQIVVYIIFVALLEARNKETRELLS